MPCFPFPRGTGSQQQEGRIDWKPSTAEKPRREAAPITSAAAPYLRCVSCTLLPASPAACPDRMAGKQAPPGVKSHPTLQEWAVGVWGKPGSHCRAAPSTHGASSDAPALSPIRGWWLHQHLHLQLGGQPAQDPRGIRLRPTTLIACGPLHGAQPLLCPHPLHRTGQSPEPSATAPLPSLGDKEGSAQTQDGFAGLSHPRVVPARPSPCLPARVHPTTSTDGTLALGLLVCPHAHLFPKLWPGVRPAGCRAPLSSPQRKVRGFPGCGKKQEPAACNSSQAHPDTARAVPQHAQEQSLQD